MAAKPVCMECGEACPARSNFCWLCGAALKRLSPEQMNSELNNLRDSLLAQQQYAQHLEGETERLRKELGYREHNDEMHRKKLLDKNIELGVAQMKLGRKEAGPKASCLQTLGIILAIFGIGAIAGALWVWSKFVP